MKEGAETGASDVSSRVFRSDRRFNAVKVFSATLFADRTDLGERVTEWIASNSHFVVIEMIVTQSSDEQFHCIAITVFYWAPPRP